MKHQSPIEIIKFCVFLVVSILVYAILMAYLNYREGKIKKVPESGIENQGLINNDQSLDKFSENQKNQVNRQIQEKFHQEWEQRKAEFVKQIQEDLEPIQQKQQKNTIKAVFSHNDFAKKVGVVISSDPYLNDQIQSLKTQIEQLQNALSDIKSLVNQYLIHLYRNSKSLEQFSVQLPQEIQQQILQHFPQNQQTLQSSILSNLDEKLQNLKQDILSEANTELEKQIAQNSPIQNLITQLKNFIQQQEELRGDIKKSTEIQLNQVVLQIIDKQYKIPQRLQKLELRKFSYQTKVYKTIRQLYEKSLYKNNVGLPNRFFVREIQSEQQLFKNYSITSSAMKEKLRGLCNEFRQVRGDGNCFYTSFGYQFLLILLNKYKDQQFGEFIKRMKDLNLSMKINLQEIKIDDQNIEQKLLYEFLFRLEDLRMIPNLKEREKAFTIQYAAYEKEGEIDGIFYGLSTIFFRNLANLAVGSSEQLAGLYDRQNLLIWETECNSNKIVIEALSTYLKIHISLIFFDNGGFKEHFYGKEFKDRIILLIQSGLYNIGIKQQEDLQ